MSNFRCSKSFPFISENKSINSHPEFFLLNWTYETSFLPILSVSPHYAFLPARAPCSPAPPPWPFPHVRICSEHGKGKGEDAGLSAQYHLPQAKRAASKPQSSALWFCHPPRASRSPPCHSPDVTLKGEAESEGDGPTPSHRKKEMWCLQRHLSIILTACHSTDRRTGTGASVFSVPWQIPKLISSLTLTALKNLHCS